MRIINKQSAGKLGVESKRGGMYLEQVERWAEGIDLCNKSDQHRQDQSLHSCQL